MKDRFGKPFSRGARSGGSLGCTSWRGPAASGVVRGRGNFIDFAHRRVARCFQSADCWRRTAGFCGILSRRENWICAHLSAAAGFSSLATQFDPAGSASPDAAAYLVVGRPGCLSRPFGCGMGEQRSACDDSVLVREQLLRSADRRRLHALSHRRADSVHAPSKRGAFLPLRRLFLFFFFVVSLLHLCLAYSLLSLWVLANLAGTIYLKRPRRVNRGPLDFDLGDSQRRVFASDFTLTMD